MNQSEVETAEEETSTNEIGTLEHLEEMHEQIIQVDIGCQSQMTGSDLE